MRGSKLNVLPNFEIGDCKVRNGVVLFRLFFVLVIFLIFKLFLEGKRGLRLCDYKKHKMNYRDNYVGTSLLCLATNDNPGMVILFSKFVIIFKFLAIKKTDTKTDNLWKRKWWKLY